MMRSSLKSHTSPYLIALITITTLLLCTTTTNAAPGAKVASKEEPSSAPAVATETKPILINKRQTYGLSNSNRNPNPIPSVPSSFGYQYSNNPLSSYPNSLNNNYNDNYRGSSSSNYMSGTGPRSERDYYPSSGLGVGSSSYTNSMGTGTGRSGYFYNDRDRQSLPYVDDYRYNSGYQRDNYPRDRDAMASVNHEYSVRHGQQRHEEYQKRTGQGGPEYYDPFYFIGVRNQQNQNSLDRPTSFSSISPTLPIGSIGTVQSVVSSPSNSLQNLAVTSPVAPLRNRRNSHHQRANDFYNEINGDKYDIMGKSAYPTGGSGNHPNNHHHHNNHNHHLPNYPLVHSISNQFLTREQLLRNPDMRVPYQSNHIDHYASSGAGHLPWSVRIGTQLKVNDDGRSPNPNRFYVRDEINPTKSRSRYPNPIYRRK